MGYMEIFQSFIDYTHVVCLRRVYSEGKAAASSLFAKDTKLSLFVSTFSFPSSSSSSSTSSKMSFSQASAKELRFNLKPIDKPFRNRLAMEAAAKKG